MYFRGWYEEKSSRYLSTVCWHTLSEHYTTLDAHYIPFIRIFTIGVGKIIFFLFITRRSRVLERNSTWAFSLIIMFVQY